MKKLASILLLSAASYVGVAQNAPSFATTCDERGASKGSSMRYCETRDLTLPSPGPQTLTIDGQDNGGISVQGWDGSDVRVRAKVVTWAKTDAEATQLAKGITISTAANTLHATSSAAQGAIQGWAVSYEVFVPRKTALVLQTKHGGISLSNLESAITFTTQNGGISLANVAGQVKGQTTNGGVSIRLTGPTWQGEGLDVQTTNGGISWSLPKDYSAKFVTSTSMGGITAGGLPVTKSGMMRKEIMTTLGQGGATIKAVTTNGGISVRQR
ncbi:DUF4097 family beta strand repeat-containing protein [Hymenobacter persicinus]|uniref:DUF4097 domain-containing protein n=1 Tax=Hymenobacter persicinus TaxID=2025506 RepID=A0A4Q5LGQ4_9BACT|nr:DUF4097 family beta strand repeat-containing protein [Hymenobacter persicinus]RYU82848.1 hypothetical protein EWM57_03935 [Hymenobacter persicinus]